MTRYALYASKYYTAEARCMYRSGNLFERFFNRALALFWRYRLKSLTVGEAEKVIKRRKKNGKNSYQS